MKNTDDIDRNPMSQVSWKTRFALIVLAKPILRFIGRKSALKHLNTQILLDPRATVFILLTRLGQAGDPEFAWHVYNLLLSVPELVFEDKWVNLALLPIENIPGQTIRERIATCERVILQSFGLWRAVSTAQKLAFITIS